MALSNFRELHEIGFITLKKCLIRNNESEISEGFRYDPEFVRGAQLPLF